MKISYNFSCYNFLPFFKITKLVTPTHMNLFKLQYDSKVHLNIKNELFLSTRVNGSRLPQHEVVASDQPQITNRKTLDESNGRGLKKSIPLNHPVYSDACLSIYREEKKLAIKMACCESSTTWPGLGRGEKERGRKWLNVWLLCSFPLLLPHTHTNTHKFTL